jgi:putative hydrolase of the HAD superfamily
MNAALNELGLPSWLEIIVTSQDSGFNKPQPEIFQEALRRAGVQPAQAVYVGDQYRVDCVGARSAGMQGILLDRHDYFKEITDCPRIRSLSEVVEYL